MSTLASKLLLPMIPWSQQPPPSDASADEVLVCGDSLTYVTWNPAARVDMEEIQGLYVVPQIAKVRQFLQRHPFLMDIVIEARQQITEHFQECDVILRVHDDPEDPGNQSLVAYIHAPQDMEAALGHLHALDEDWFINQLESTEGLFNLLLC